jgi:cytochrome c oxidase subunit 2
LWSLVFLLVPILGVGLFAVAPAMNMWLPTDVSADGYKIDHLFKFILWLTGIVFVATECVLAWYLWKYDASRNDAKMMGRRPDVTPIAEVTGRQFEWRIRYPGADGVLHTRDDLLDVNDLHVPVDEDIALVIKSEDVLHSFFLPHFRVKQDVVPGMSQQVWFRAVPAAQGRSFDIVCAELCGWGHYKMKGRITIDSQDEFRTHLARLAAEQNATTEAKPPQVAGNE